MTKTLTALAAYDTFPMDEGDAALLLDEAVCLEVEQLAVDWDDELVKSLASTLLSASKVRLLVARRGGRPLPSDVRLWTALRLALAGRVEVQPLTTMRAA